MSNGAKRLGSKGGKATVKKHGKEQMKEWGKLGGRPKKGGTGVHLSLQEM